MFQTTLSLLCNHQKISFQKKLQKPSFQKILTYIGNKRNNIAIKQSTNQTRKKSPNFHEIKLMVFIFQEKSKRFSVLSGMAGQCYVPCTELLRFFPEGQEMCFLIRL